MIHMIKCHRCDGAGVRTLQPSLAEVVRAIDLAVAIDVRARGTKPADVWISFEDISPMLPTVKHSALCNRLALLVDEGVIAKRKHPINSKKLQWRIRQ